MSRWTTSTQINYDDPELAAAFGSRTGTRPVGQDELLFNVRDYGAIGNVTADDRAAIQATVDAAAAAGGGVVYLPAGDYKVSGPIVLPSGVMLRGASRRSARLRVTALDQSAIRILGASASVTVVQVAIRDLTVVGPGKASGGTAPGISIKWASVDIDITRCTITEWGADGVRVEDSYSLTFRQTLFVNNGGRGLQGSLNFNNVTFDRTIALGNTLGGVQVIGGTTTVFLNADFESNGGPGLDLRYVTAGAAIGCHFEKNAGSNIYLHQRDSAGEPCTAFRIVGSVVQGSATTATGVLIDGATGTQIDGAWFSGHTTEHIKTTTAASRTLIGPNTYAGAAAVLTDGSASTGRMDYSATNLMPRVSPGIKLEPRSANPPVVEEGDLWSSSATKTPRYWNGTRALNVALALENSGSLDFPSIAAGGYADLTIAVSGALGNDQVLIGRPLNVPAGLIPDAWVSAASTVTIRLYNITTAAIDPPAGGWKVAVRPAAV